MLNASIQTFTQARLVTNIRAQGIENKEKKKCSSRLHQMSFNPNWIILAGTMMHITVRCFKKIKKNSDVLLLSPQENSPIYYLKTTQNIITLLYLAKHGKMKTAEQKQR